MWRGAAILRCLATSLTSTHSSPVRTLGPASTGLRTFFLAGSKMNASAECPICREPLPVAGPVALVERQRLVHLGCYRPSPQPVRSMAGGLPNDPGKRRARTAPTVLPPSPDAA